MASRVSESGAAQGHPGAVPRGRTCFYDPASRVWSGLRTAPRHDVGQSLGQLVLGALRACDPGHVTQIGDTGPVTCGQMYERAARVAQWLTGHGYGEGTMAALASRNGEHVAPVMFACFALGITVNPLDAAFDTGDFAHMFGITRPVLLFCEQDLLATVLAGAARAGIDPRIVLFGSAEHQEAAGAGAGAGHLRIEELLQPSGREHLFVPPTLGDPARQLAVILCSSGTTGLPKGVSYTHAFCIANLPTLWRTTADDRLLAFSSLYWLSGFATLIVGTVNMATRIITRRPFSSEYALDLLARHRVTLAFFPPFHANLVVSDPRAPATDMSALKTLLCGGASVSADLYRRLQSWLPRTTEIQIGYGMSESSLIALTDRDVPYRDGTVGSPQPLTEVKIVDADTGRALEPGEHGEILLRVQYPFAGYYDNPEETAATVTSDGWISTGDIGHFDPDGLLYIVARRKEIIKYANYQILPAELETLIKLLPGVLECCVVGIPIPGSDLPAAAIIRSPGATLDEATVHDFMRSRVADYKRLRGGIYFFDTLPVTPSGKVMRRKCLETILAIRAGEPQTQT
ncbi:luciferin 4-monooxygenase-like [Anopheles cruzii]|uniref:luciferin 4-monooxygenase-like n=1 Tax=Anopheles cruzii TaxID=68878 RepID=UPI0022EC57AF|nr:luciferin 4-monooxygenase-like [Anopheles cruzii]